MKEEKEVKKEVKIYEIKPKISDNEIRHLEGSYFIEIDV